jgi:hypothetical protein
LDSFKTQKKKKKKKLWLGVYNAHLIKDPGFGGGVHAGKKLWIAELSSLHK